MLVPDVLFNGTCGKSASVVRHACPVRHIYVERVGLSEGSVREDSGLLGESAEGLTTNV